MPLHCSERFDRECEDIADASLGLDDARRARIDLKLAPQSQDLDIDAPIENILMHARGLQQMSPRERALRCFKKGKQQGILTLAQRDRGRIGVDKLSTTAVEYPTVEPVPASLRSLARAVRPISCRRKTARTRASNSLRLKGFTM